MPYVEKHDIYKMHLTEKSYIEEEHTIVRTVRNADEYIQVYSKIVSALNNVGNAAVKTALWLATQEPVRYFQLTQVIQTPQGKKIRKYKFKAIQIVDTYEILSRRLNTTPRTIARHIGELRKAGLVIELDKGINILNPEYFWKTASKDRKETIHIIIKQQSHEPVEKEEGTVIAEEVEILPNPGETVELTVEVK